MTLTRRKLDCHVPAQTGSLPISPAPRDPTTTTKNERLSYEGPTPKDICIGKRRGPLVIPRAQRALSCMCAPMIAHTSHALSVVAHELSLSVLILRAPSSIVYLPVALGPNSFRATSHRTLIIRSASTFCFRRLVRTHNNFSSNEGPVWMPPPREPHTRYSQSCDEETSEIGPDECYSFSNQTATPTAIKQISVSKLLNAT